MTALINLCWYVSRTWNKIVKLLEIMLSKIENIRLTFYECAISDWNLWENVKGLRIHFYLLPWSYPTSNTHFSCFFVLKVFLLDIIVPKNILHNRYLQRKAYQLYRKMPTSRNFKNILYGVHCNPLLDCLLGKNLYTSYTKTDTYGLSK